MSLKNDLRAISIGHGTVSIQYMAYYFARWYRNKNFAGPHFPGILEIMDDLAEKSEDYLEQEYARFILETSE